MHILGSQPSKGRRLGITCTTYLYSPCGNGRKRMTITVFPFYGYCNVQKVHNIYQCTQNCSVKDRLHAFLKCKPYTPIIPHPRTFQNNRTKGSFNNQQFFPDIHISSGYDSRTICQYHRVSTVYDEVWYIQFSKKSFILCTLKKQNCKESKGSPPSCRGC